MQAEKKPLYTSLAAGLLVLIVAFAILDHWHESLRNVVPITQHNASTTQNGTAAGLPAEIITQASSTDLYTIHVEYPRFPSAPQLNQQMDAYVTGMTNEFVKNVQENAQARRDNGAPSDFKYTMDISWEHAQLNTRYVSLILHYFAFEGGANGRQELKSFNWDMQQNKEVPLLSLFPDGSLTSIATYSRNVLKSTLGDNTTDEFLSSGTNPIADNFQWYTFTDDAVTIWFPKYQVAPGAAGEQKVVMPRNGEGVF